MKQIIVVSTIVTYLLYMVCMSKIKLNNNAYYMTQLSSQYADISFSNAYLLFVHFVIVFILKPLFDVSFCVLNEQLAVVVLCNFFFFCNCNNKFNDLL